jgi:hypothetical protein
MRYNKKNNIYLLGKKLGLKYNEIDEIITNTKFEQVNISSGPNWYPGTHYGTLSIKEII